MKFSPVNASKQITESYKRYLKTMFEIADPDYYSQLVSEMDDDRTFSAGPYLDVTDSFITGKSISELISDAVLPKSFSKIRMHQTRPLYKHQEEAVLKAAKGENIVVSTGTGSGKTESFLIPIFRRLVAEDEAGTLTPGVRALLIYPMNALANDQVERMRDLLADYPSITFGCYTGQTQNKYPQALAEYRALNNNQEPLTNELISRDQMKVSPPNILITNYAMLEYLMIRPEDSVFFDGKYSDNWSFIVLDEAHVYNGSTGIEVSMLLSRLKAKLFNPKIQYILTSATLGGEEDNADVARFAQDLCRSTFYFENVIRAQRITLFTQHETKSLPIAFYDQLADRINADFDDNSLIEFVHPYTEISVSGDIHEVLHEIVLHDDNYWKIKSFMDEPKTITAIADKIGWPQKSVENFVTVASLCEYNGTKLFDARYHMFLRATDSVFISLSPVKKLFLTRKEEHVENDGTKYKVFEIGTCDSCHVIYLLGSVDGNGILLQKTHFRNKSELDMFMISADNLGTEDIDIDLAEPYEICPYCAHTRHRESLTAAYCEHGKEAYLPVLKIKHTSEDRALTSCPHCGNSSSQDMLRMFFAGQEAVTSVLGTSLFEQLPATSIIREIQPVDDLGFDDAADTSEHSVKESKQFLAFSDSRQAAAFYATYFDESYRNILNKRLILEAMKHINASLQPAPVDQFAQSLTAEFEKYGIGDSKLERRNNAWIAILSEVINNNGMTALSTLGLLGISVDFGEGISNSKLQLSKSDFNAICSEMAIGMMTDAAVKYDVPLSPEQKELFVYGGIEKSYSKSDSTAKYVSSFLPSKANIDNKRLDYMRRILKKNNPEIDRDYVLRILEHVWNTMFVKSGVMEYENGTYKINANRIMVDDQSHWYICSQCHRITKHNVRGVCPSFHCEGELAPLDVNKRYQNNHYYRMYHEMEIRPLRIVEHTAQLDKETAYDYQKKFKNKQIDVLSCSTTFEMGVDVGTLETVFMRNMPPSPANYSQRAGRAGRTKQSAAYALTFCSKRSHDFTYFLNPVKMIKGKINPPKFKIENEKIAIRHLYASTLGFFWKKYPAYFKNATKMLDLQDDTEKSGYQLLEEYIDSKPQDLRMFAEAFLTENLALKFGVDSFAWKPQLIKADSDNPGVLTKAMNIYHNECAILYDALRTLAEDDMKRIYLLQRIKNYKNDEILSFLSRNGVLPKYGFPVDTVSLSIVDTKNNTNLGLELQRDLAIAISEYAPGSQIVANGHLITSRYIRKVPNMSWKMYDYIICGNCRTTNIDVHIDSPESTKLSVCSSCQNPLEITQKHTFLIPSFGFVADGSKIQKPGLTSPKRTYNSEVTYISNKEAVDSALMLVGNGLVELSLSGSDEMVVLNQSPFYVCEDCGYAEIDKKEKSRYKKKKHERSNGSKCAKESLRKYSLGYRFQTDVIKITFLNPGLVEFNQALSVLYGMLRGVSQALNIEESDISGCLVPIYSPEMHSFNYGLIIYDSTPGGSGHVRRLQNAVALSAVMKTTLQIMENCTCGGDKKDSSCYSCLRSYYNQSHHDELKRSYVIDFLKSSFGDFVPEVIDKNLGFDPRWLQVLRQIYDEAGKVYINKIIESQLPPPSCVGYELVGEHDEVVAMAELVWESNEIAWLLTDQEPNRDVFEREGWKVFKAGDVLKVEDFEKN